VRYDGPLSQNIKDPVASTYTNLAINGAGDKILQNNIILSNNLTIEGANLTHNNGTLVSSLSIAGDWLNTGGTHDGTEGVVTLTSTAIQKISHTWGTRTESFFQLYISGASTKTLDAHLLVNDFFEINSEIDVSIDDYQLELKKDFDINGSFLPQNGLVKMTGSVAQNINCTGIGTFFDLEIDNTAGVSLNTGTYNVRGTVRLTNGLFTTNNVITLISDGTYQGSIGEITGGDISGDVVLQRYIPPGNTDWRLLASGISGTSVSDWNDDFITAGFTGSDFPTFSFTSMYSYDETVSDHRDSGWVAVPNITQATTPGKGIMCYVGDGQTTTNAIPLDVTGAINKGTIGIPVTYTGGFSISDDGWNLVGNPYPSSINWDATGWTKTNVHDVVYIWDPSIGNFSVHIGGAFPADILGGSNIIGSSQGFWVQTSGSSPVLSVSESCKNSSDVWKLNNTFQESKFKIKLSDGNFTDETMIRLIPGATPLFDENMDASKLYSMKNDAPGIASVVGEKDLAINSYSNNENLEIPIRSFARVSGIYTISFEGIENFEASSCLIFEDLFTGLSYDPRSTSSITVNLSDTTINSIRFLLHISKPIEKNIQHISCNGIFDGNITVVGQGAGNWDYNWFDLNNDLFSSSINSLGGDTLENLGPGMYIFEVNNADSFCGGIIRDTILIEEPEVLETIIKATHETCFNNKDGEILLNIIGGTQPYTYQWNTGTADMSMENLEPGIYGILVEDFNGCEREDSIEIQPGVNVVSNFTVNFDSISLVSGGILQVNNLSQSALNYSWDFGDGESISTEMNPFHQYAYPGDYVVSLTSVNGQCTSQFVMEITVIDDVIKQVSDGLYFIQNGSNLSINYEEQALYKNIKLIDIFGREHALTITSNEIGKIKCALPKVSSGTYIIVLYNEVEKDAKIGKIMLTN